MNQGELGGSHKAGATYMTQNGSHMALIILTVHITKAGTQRRHRLSTDRAFATLGGTLATGNLLVVVTELAMLLPTCWTLWGLGPLHPHTNPWCMRPGTPVRDCGGRRLPLASGRPHTILPSFSLTEPFPRRRILSSYRVLGVAGAGITEFRPESQRNAVYSPPLHTSGACLGRRVLGREEQREGVGREEAGLLSWQLAASNNFSDLDQAFLRR